MDQLFGVQVHAISKHLKNIFAEGEMDAHLTQESSESDNRRNGKMQKQVQTPVGDITVTAPRDRDASFDPQFIKKREQALGTSAVGLKRQLAHPYLPRL